MPGFTKQAIKACFLQLLSQYPLKDITVRMIVETCGINRKSFYYHYRDIPALLTEIVKEKIGATLDAYHEFHCIEDCMALILRDLIAQKAVIRHIYDSVSRDVFESAQMKVCDYFARAYVSDLQKDRSLRAADKDLLIGFYRSQCFGIIMDWMMRGMPEDIFDALHRICSVREGFAEEFVKRLSSAGP